jgi:hypothetical protein|tara:strand:- start:5 stop:535 length:531 start_codon:yes stop_codon:yes gene_type:complete
LQLDLFIKEIKTEKIGGLDISAISIKFGNVGQRRIDLNRTSDFLNSVPKGKYLIYPTGGSHPLPMYKERSDFPYILNTETNNIIIPNCSRAVYPCYTISNENKGVRVYAHRIMGMAYIDNPLPIDNYNVDHINEDKLDYSIDNLRWVSVSDNMKGVKNRARSKNKEYKFYSSENFI